MEHAGRRIPNNLKRHRKIAGYLQKDVAFLLGHTSTNQLCRWEQGQAVPGILNLIKLSIIFRTLPHELYFDLFKEQQEMIKQKEQARFVQLAPQLSS